MLHIENISKRFGDVQALSNVSLDLQPGLFGLLGPNGAGKSTLMRTLATLQLPDEGHISYNGQDIASHPNAMREVLGYLPQDFGVYPRMSAEALLNHIAVLKGVHNDAQRKRQVLGLLKQVNLVKHRRSSVANYSGGMRQRFGVAQAMLGNPKVLIVDEPTAGLDPFERQRFLKLLYEAAEDKIIILSTHIVEDVRDLCTDMAIMGEGRIVARGNPEDLIAKVQGKVYRTFVSDEEADKLAKEHRVLATAVSKGRIRLSVLSDDPISDHGFAAAEATLEDAYFAHLYGLI